MRRLRLDHIQNAGRIVVWTRAPGELAASLGANPAVSAVVTPWNGAVIVALRERAGSVVAIVRWTEGAPAAIVSLRREPKGYGWRWHRAIADGRLVAAFLREAAA